MKKVIIYAHGKGGNAAESEYYKRFFPDCDVFGVDYGELLPWTARERIADTYDSLKGRYDRISLIANSIGAYFSMLALQNRSVARAYFISPILNMERLIADMMLWSGVSETELKERGEIPTELGETLSWQYLCYVRDNPIKWDVPTALLYAGGDKLTARHTVDRFAADHNASVTVMENGEHWFHTEEQLDFLDNWLKRESGADR